ANRFGKLFRLGGEFSGSPIAAIVGVNDDDFISVTRGSFLPQSPKRSHTLASNSYLKPILWKYKRKNGAVTTVLKIAINTSMANTFGGMTPRSKPTLITMSSIRARVFIMMPRQPASSQFRPKNLPANAQPKNFPNVAAAMTMRHQPQSVVE